MTLTGNREVEDKTIYDFELKIFLQVHLVKLDTQQSQFILNPRLNGLRRGYMLWGENSQASQQSGKHASKIFCLLGKQSFLSLGGEQVCEH